MSRREELEQKVEELERELATLRATRFRNLRLRASWGLGNLPMYEIAIGPDPTRGEIRGHARAVFAFGDIATGFVALGGWARGLIAVGGMATGLLSIGGLSIGVLGAFGGLAIGALACGGGALGAVAVGGGAVGHYACGGGAVGDHVISAERRDPEAVEFFRAHGMKEICLPEPRSRARPPMPEAPLERGN